ncbi:MAG: hypothetical protein ACRC2S_00835 [Waterburya sp.]
MSEKIVITKVQYFIDYWRDFLYSDSIEEDLTHTVVYNPRELFQEFADEISRKEFKNKDNKNFFINSINKFCEFKIKSTKYLQPTLSLIKQQFNNPNFQYLLHLLSIVDRELSNNKLGLNCINELEKILTDNTELNDHKKEIIKILTNFIIFELLNKEYSIKSIREFVFDIFDDYQINQDGILSTSYPHNCQIDFKLSSNSTEFQQYQSEIKEIIDNLDLSKRLLSIKNYFDKVPKKLTYIFQIKGLKGEIDATFGNVRIYNPQTVKLIQNYPYHLNLFDEYFDSPQFLYCNGAVTLEVFDDEYAKEKAAILLNEVIDVLLSSYTQYEMPVTINTTKILTCDEHGNPRGMSSTSNSDIIYHHKSIEINQSTNIEYLADYYNSITINRLNIDLVILESLHWRRKAIESFNINDQILWHWISIENLFRDTNLIFKVLPKLFAINRLYCFAWKHYRKLNNINDSSLFGYFRKDLKLPEELCQKIGLTRQEGNIYLNDFINNIIDIKKELKSDELLYEQLNYLEIVFNDQNSCIELLENFKQMSYEQLIFVYRIRNKIVHNANNKNTTTSNYYLNFICKASLDILFEFIRKRSNQTLNLKSVDDLLNEIIYDFDKLKLEINKNGTGILFNHN